MANVITVAVTESNVTVTDTPLNINVSTTDDTITVTESNSIITVADSVSNIIVSNTTFNTITSNTDLSIANLSVAGNVDVGGNSELSGNVRVGSNADVNTMITNVDVQTGKIVMERDIAHTEFNGARPRQIDIQTVDYNVSSNVYTTTGLNNTGLRIVGPAGGNASYDAMPIPAISFNYSDTIFSTGGYSAANPFNIAFEYNGAGATAGNLLLSSGGGSGMAGNHNRVKINTFTDIDGVLTLANGLVVGKNSPDAEITHSLDILAGNDIGFLGTPSTTRGNIEGVGNINAVGNITTLGTFVGDGSGLTGIPTNAEVQAFIQDNGLVMTNTITSDSNITTTGVATFGNSATQTHTFTGNLDVTGNIEVSGNLNYRNVEDLYVRDQSITLNANAASDATVSIIANRPVAGANTVLRWNETSDAWQFTNDGTTFYNIPTSTSDLAEGTNLYFTNARSNTVSRAAISVTTNSPSGNGSLSYSNTTGVFTFTPADTSAGGGGGNYGDSNVTSLLSGGTISNITMDNGLLVTKNDATNNFKINGSSMEWNTNFITQATRLKHFRDDTYTAASNEWWRYGGTIANATAVTNEMLVSTQQYYGYDGSRSIDQTAPQAKYTVFVDTANGGAVAANNVPLAHEFVVQPDAMADIGSGTSVTKKAMLTLTANGHIYFNREGAQGNYGSTAKANIDPDGSFSSNANITAVGNISGSYILGNGSQLTGITTSGVSNAQAQAFIQSSGLTMTAAISSNSLISTTGNLDLNIATSVDNLYGVRFDSGTNKFISSPNITSEAPTHFITIEKESTDLELIRSRIARTGANGTRLLFEKSEGTLASPVALGDFDTIWETEYSGWDGNKYENSFGTHVFQDRETSVTSADTVPLAYEFYAKPSGDTTSNDISIMSLHSDGKIVFNDVGGTRGFNDKTGTANISRDGSIVSAANITATGNIAGNYIIGNGSLLTGITGGGSGISNAQAQAYIQENGLAMTSNLTSNSLISTTGNLQVNADTTSAIGMKGLTYRSDFNLLGLGTTAANTGLDILCDGNQYAAIFLRENADTFFGPDLSTYKARGSVASPSAVSVGDRMMELKPSGYSGSGYINSMGQIMYVDSTNAISSTSMPMGFSWEGYKDGDVSGGTGYASLMKLRANGDLQIGSLGFNSGNTAPNFAVTHGGTVSAVGNITTTANISGNYILGDGSQLSNLPSGVSNAQAQAYIQENGLTMTSVISSNSNITTTANINAAGGTLTGVVTSDSNIELTDAFFVGDLDGAVVQDVRNETGSTLNKGSAVYLTGSATGDTPHVALADNSNSSLMPAMGIVYENIANASVGQVATSGVINYTSHGFTQGADLFVSTGGALTETAPTGESAGIQKIGKVVSANHILVSGASRVNATPNLNANSIFIGNSTNQATTVGLNSLSSSIVTNKRLEGDRFAGGNITLPITQYLTSGFVYVKFDNAVDPFLPNGTKVFFQDTDANNPLSNGSITSDNIFYTRKSSSFSYYLLYSDEACQNLVSTSVPTTSPTNANVTFGSMIATGPLTMSAGTGAELVNGSNAFAKDFYVRNNVTIGETALRDAVLDISGDTTMTNYSGNAALTLVNNRNDSAIPTQLVMKQNKSAGFAAGVAGDALSVLKTQGMTTNTGSGLKTYANVLAKITDPTDGAEDGEIDFRLIKAGTETSTMLLKSTEMELNVPLVTELTSNANININTRVDSVPSNATINVSDVQAYNNGNLTEDSISIPGGQILADGTAISYSGATDGDITPLNGRVYYIKFNSGDGGRYELFDDSGFTTGSRRVTNGVFRSSGVGQFEYVSSTNVAAGGNLNIGGSNAVIQSLGGNITSVGNISGNYILGDGSQLTNIPGSTDSFGTVAVAGQTNIQATQANAQLTLASSGAITLTTSGNTVTIGGTGGSYGNTDVETFLGSDTMTGDVIYKGNLQLSSANVSTAITEYQGNTTTGSGDRVIVGSDPGWFNGQEVTFSGTTNAALTFLNGNTYQVAGSGTVWTLYTNYNTFTKLETATGTESPTGLVANHRTPDNTTARIHGNVFCEPGGVLHTDELKSATPGKVITLTALRVSDFKANDPLGIQSYANSAISGLTPFTGSIIYVTGDRHGSRGAPAYFDGSDFRYFSDDALVTT